MMVVEPRVPEGLEQVPFVRVLRGSLRGELAKFIEKVIRDGRGELMSTSTAHLASTVFVHPVNLHLRRFENPGQSLRGVPSWVAPAVMWKRTVTKKDLDGRFHTCY